MTVVTFAEDATASVAGVDPATDPAPKMRVMLPGACALCACTSARRWYRLDEPMPTSDPTDDPGGDVTYAQILIVDAGADKAAAWELGVVATPALFFYFDGERLRVRRPEREDDDKFVGAATQEQLLEVILVYGRKIS